jgi:large subunit ribosomal protein L4
MKLPVYLSDGTKKGDISLSGDMFGAEIVVGLMHDALLRQQGNARLATACAKTRSEVRGGGKKPWRQKGTGRARQGSIRSAQWRGGGVIFGPRPDRNFRKNMTKKMRRKALLSALSVKMKEGSIFVLDSFAEEKPSTKVFFRLLGTLGCSGRVLVVIPGRDIVLEKSARNIPGVKTIFAQYLNVEDILTAKNMLFLGDGLRKAEEIFGCKK